MRALEADIKAGKPTIPDALREMGESVAVMSNEQFAAFLDLLEAGIPEREASLRRETHG